MTARTAYPDTAYARALGTVPPRPAPCGVIEAETAVIGGGLAGIATALDLAERGRDVVVLEARRVGWGASGRNGGFVSDAVQEGAASLEPTVGLHHAQEIHRLTRDAVTLLRGRIDRYRIACGPRPGFVQPGVMRAAFRGRDARLQAWRDRMARDYDTPWEYWPAARLREALATDRYADALTTEDGFAVDPLAMTRGLAAAAEDLGARIFETAPVRGARRIGTRWRLRLQGAEVRADHVVLAGGAYVGPQFPRLWAAMVPAATFVMTTAPLGDRLTRAIAIPHAIYDLKFATNYYRRLPDLDGTGGRLLWGGRVLGWEKSPPAAARALHRDLAAMYPDLRDATVEVAWSGRLPILRHGMCTVLQTAPNWWVATGFGGHGLALTTMAGRLLGSAIADGDDRWRLFARSDCRSPAGHCRGSRRRRRSGGSRGGRLGKVGALPRTPLGPEAPDPRLCRAGKTSAVRPSHARIIRGQLSYRNDTLPYVRDASPIGTASYGMRRSR